MLDDNLHSGHRERLRKRFQEEGLDSFEDHQVLELLLFHVLPRGDTNPIAICAELKDALAATSRGSAGVMFQ